MKTVKTLSELREKSERRPARAREELAEQLFALRLQKTTGSSRSPRRSREARRELARMLTVLREKRQAADEVGDHERDD